MHSSGCGWLELKALMISTATPISALCTLMIFYALGKNSETIAGWKSISCRSPSQN